MCLQVASEGNLYLSGASWSDSLLQVAIAISFMQSEVLCDIIAAWPIPLGWLRFAPLSAAVSAALLGLAQNHLNALVAASTS